MSWKDVQSLNNSGGQGESSINTELKNEEEFYVQLVHLDDEKGKALIEEDAHLPENILNVVIVSF